MTVCTALFSSCCAGETSTPFSLNPVRISALCTQPYFLVTWRERLPVLSPLTLSESHDSVHSLTFYLPDRGDFLSFLPQPCQNLITVGTALISSLLDRGDILSFLSQLCQNLITVCRALLSSYWVGETSSPFSLNPVRISSKCAQPYFLVTEWGRLPFLSPSTPSESHHSAHSLAF
jgi:hypothetical protein